MNPACGTARPLRVERPLTTMGDGTNIAMYSHVANSPLVSQIAFAENGTNRMTTSKQYDLLNRLTNVVNTPAADSAVSFAYRYNAANQRTNVTEADGSRWVYGYDSLGQVISGKKYWSDGTPVAGQQFDYGFDDIGNRKQTKAGGDANGNTMRSAIYTANSLYQYTERTVPGYVDVIGSATNSATVTVNANGTSRKSDYYRAEVPVSNSSTSLWQSITNTAVLAVGTNDLVTNALGSVFVPQTPEHFTYDDDGNLITDGRWTNRWDAENRLVAVTSLADIPTAAKALLAFSYDYQGRRVRKTSVIANPSGGFYPSVQRRYVYDGWNCIAELDSTNGLLRSYVWGTDLSGNQQGAGGVGGLVAMTIHTGSQSGSYFYGYDGNGNVSTLVNATNGTAMAAYQYDPFGRVLKAVGSLASTNAYRFSTKVQDEETGWNYYGYRNYDSIKAKWLSRDLIEEVGGVNIYGFVANNGLNQIDELGLFSPSDSFKEWGYHFWRDNFVTSPQWREVMDNWYYEKGRPPMTYTGNGDPRNADIAKNTGFRKLLACWIAKKRGDSVPTSSEWTVDGNGFWWHYGYWGFLGLGNSAGGSAAYDSATHFLGSYDATLTLVGKEGDKDVLDVVVYNRSGWVSGTRTEGIPMVGAI